jgi:hypothetical protein
LTSSSTLGLFTDVMLVSLSLATLSIEATFAVTAASCFLMPAFMRCPRLSTIENFQRTMMASHSVSKIPYGFVFKGRCFRMFIKAPFGGIAAKVLGTTAWAWSGGDEKEKHWA